MSIWYGLIRDRNNLIDILMLTKSSCYVRVWEMRLTAASRDDCINEIGLELAINISSICKWHWRFFFALIIKRAFLVCSSPFFVADLENILCVVCNAFFSFYSCPFCPGTLLTVAFRQLHKSDEKARNNLSSTQIQSDSIRQIVNASRSSACHVMFI